MSRVHEMHRLLCGPQNTLCYVDKFHLLIYLLRPTSVCSLGLWVRMKIDSGISTNASKIVFHWFLPTE